MEWFRAYHGICSDQKWPIVARKAKVSVGTVVSVWLALLEFASQAAERGSVAAFDPETMDALYGYDDGTTATVFGALTEKGLICDGRICAWGKRQPKRERDDDSAARVRQHRELKRRETTDGTTIYHGNASVTPCNASVTPPEQNREEQRREDIKYTSPDGEVVGGFPPTPPDDELLMPEESSGQPEADSVPLCPHGKIVAAYHELLPELPQVKVWEGSRKQHLQARWRERWKAGKYRTQPEGLAYWQRLFRHVHENCDWLMGRISGQNSRAFRADLAWLVRPENFAKLIEGKYDNRGREAA